MSFSSGFAQETSPKETNPTQDKDVPKQEPGTNNPDIAPDHHHSSGSKSQGSGSSKQPSGQSSGETDVPEQKPGTNNPDVGKQHHPTPKKRSRQKSTDQSGTSR